MPSNIAQLSDEQLNAMLQAHETSARPDISQLSDEDLQGMLGGMANPTQEAFQNMNPYLREAGVIGKGVATGLTGVADLPIMAGNYLYKQLSGNEPKVPTLTPILNEAIDKASYNQFQPQNMGERFAQTGAEFLGGGAGFNKVLGLENTVGNAAPAVVAGLAGQGVKEAGGGTAAQIAAMLAGGLGAGAAMSQAAPKAAQEILASGTPLENVNAAIQPVRQQFSQQGREVAGNYATAKAMGKDTILDANKFLTPMLDNIASSLKDKGAYLDIENAALPTRIVKDLTDMSKEATVDVNRLGRMRQNITRNLYKETNPNAKTALQTIKSSFDDAWNNLGEQSILEGNPKAIDQWRKSVEEYSKHAKKFGTDIDAGQSPVFENIIKKNQLTNEELGNAVLGASFGKGSSGQTAKRLIDNAGEAAPQVQENLRNGVVLRTLKKGRVEEGTAYSIPKTKAAFKDLLEEHPDLVKTVFNQKEINSLTNFANSRGGIGDQINWLTGKTPVINKLMEFTGAEKALAGGSKSAKDVLNKAFKDAEFNLLGKPVYYGNGTPMKITIPSGRNVPGAKIPPQIQEIMK